METTLRDGAADQQVVSARRKGFFTSMIYIATDDVEAGEFDAVARFLREFLFP